MHRFLHPALQALNSLIQSEDPDNFLRLHEQDIISSSAFVIKMYLNFLYKVVPANVSYFHFMREKDFYIHLTALRYAVRAGYLNRSYLRQVHVFAQISSEVKVILLRLISHWLYDMVKYCCSTIYIESKTLPHLVEVLTVIICGLIEEKRENMLDSYQPA